MAAAAASACPMPSKGVIYDTASISTLHALAAARERAVPDVRERRARRTRGLGRVPRLLLRPGALVGRQGGHPARASATTSLRKIPCDDEFRMRADALAGGHRRRSPPGHRRRWRSSPRSARRRRPASIRCARSRRSARRERSGCTSTPRTPASRRWSRASSICSTASRRPTRSSSIRTSGCSRRSISACSTAGTWTCCGARSRSCPST